VRRDTAHKSPPRLDWESTTDQSASYTNWLMPLSPHWRIGGVFLIGLVSVVGAVLGIAHGIARPAFFRSRAACNRSMPNWRRWCSATDRDN
jgi:hypothetical protein